MSAKFKNAVLMQTLFAILFATNLASAKAQNQTGKQVPKGSTATVATGAVPLINEYRGVKIGMPVSEVRDTVERHLKAKGEKQDFLVLSDTETAQIFYDNTGKVTAISIDYLSSNDHAPAPVEILGTDITPKPDGSVYALKRYPAAGYWVSYYRTSGDSPTVTITLQALQ